MIPAVVLLANTGLNFGPLNRRFVPDTALARGMGLLLTVAGLAITVWARIHLGQFWSARVSLKEDHQLIQSGPYARVRHPIYSGLLLALLGTALFVGQYRAILAVLLVFIAHRQKAAREETLLAEQFGEAFQKYREHTGAILPRLFL
jgi:protein-S-isoprenylcysteine O-methyltransferase Ste14